MLASFEREELLYVGSGSRADRSGKPSSTSKNISSGTAVCGGLGGSGEGDRKNCEKKLSLTTKSQSICI